MKVACFAFALVYLFSLDATAQSVSVPTGLTLQPTGMMVSDWYNSSQRDSRARSGYGYERVRRVRANKSTRLKGSGAFFTIIGMVMTCSGLAIGINQRDTLGGKVMLGFIPVGVVWTITGLSLIGAGSRLKRRKYSVQSW